MPRNWTARLAGMIRLIGLALALLMILWVVLGVFDNRREIGSERLYWEYAGRMLGTNWTQGYPEWVQQRDGDVPGASAAAGESGQLAPYSDFVAEYPPGALLYFAALRRAQPDYAGFAATHNVLSGAAFLVALALALSTARQLLRPVSQRVALPLLAFAALACPVMVYLNGSFVVTRFDALTAAFAAGGILASLRGRSALAGLLLGLGGAIKLWPLFLVAALWGRPRDLILAGVAAAGAFAACHAGLLAFGTSPGDLLGYLTYVGDRPIHAESLMAMGHYLSEGGASLAFSFGSWNLADDVASALPGILQTGFLVIMAGLLLARLLAGEGGWQHPETRADMTLLQLSVVALLLVMSKVFSGEYMIWLAPLALAAVARWYGLGLAVALVAMAGVKLGYVLSESSRNITSPEIAAFVIKWSALLLLVAGGITVFMRAMLRPKGEPSGD